MPLLARSHAALLPTLTVFALVSLLVVPAAHAQELRATDRGSYRNDGFHNPANDNYVVGQDTQQFRNFFVFDIPTLAAGREYTAASFTFNTYFVFTPDASETLIFNDYTGSITALVNGTGGTSAYNDLGGGTTYGSITIGSNQSRQFATVTFTEQGVAAVNAAQGTQLAFGSFLSTIGADNTQELVAGGSGTFNPSDNNTRLSLTSGTAPTAVPEPGELAIMGMLGASVCGLMIRARRKAKNDIGKKAVATA